MKINYSPKFTRSYRRLPNRVKDDFDEKIKLFEQNARNPLLHTHKLKGKIESCLSFYLGDGWRVLFEYEDNDIVNLLDVGPHDWYRRWGK